jgi:predicted helicase
LHSEEYRKRYTELLSIDFPRIPFTDNLSIFNQLAKMGEELVELHLMKKSFPPAVKYEVSGSNSVDCVKYLEGRVYINHTQYFDNVPENVWNLHIGGYQVLDKWLKNRKKRELSVREILHFIQVIEVLKETIRIMNEINEIHFLQSGLIERLN